MWVMMMIMMMVMMATCGCTYACINIILLTVISYIGNNPFVSTGQGMEISFPSPN